MMKIWTALAKYASFETAGLVCRPIRFEDRDAFYEMVSVPDNARFILPLVTSQEQSDELLVQTFMTRPLGIWGICQKPTGELIGLIRLDHLDVNNGRAELGYLLKQSKWGQGLMTEAVKTLTFIAFYEIRLKELIIVCDIDNKASQRVAEKAGFRLIKRHRGSDRYTHQIRTYLTYQLTSGDYRYE
ncbi:GNAT family N-acetyltransferase [Streptococcus entericus]